MILDIVFTGNFSFVIGYFIVSNLTNLKIINVGSANKHNFFQLYFIMKFFA